MLQVIVKEVFACLLALMSAFLDMSGDGFEKRQRSAAARRQGERRYPVIAAARGTDVAKCMRSLLSLLWRLPLAIQWHQLTVRLRSIRFTMISACLCTLHVLLRLARQGCPYKVFTALCGKASEVAATPPCVRDSLAHAILERYAAWPDILTKLGGFRVMCLKP